MPTGSTPGAGVIDVSAGILTHSTTGYVMDTGIYSSYGTGVLTVRGSGYFQEQTGNFFVVNGSHATGIVNVLTGGTLEVNRIQASGGTSTINFDGGTLRAYSTNAGTNFLSGLTNAFVYPGGLNLDTNGQSVTIGQALTFPIGYGLGLSGSTISVSSGGSGYIAPPVVTFAPPAGGGVAATGVAQINANGTVTGITITSPGSGYGNDESVAVSFNGNSNTSGAATTPASGFNVPAGTQNSSGGLTVSGNGAVTLSSPGTNYTGPTTVSSGTLTLNNCTNFASAVTNNSVFQLIGSSGASSWTMNQAISGSGTVLANFTSSSAG